MASEMSVGVSKTSYISKTNIIGTSDRSKTKPHHYVVVDIRVALDSQGITPKRDCGQRNIVLFEHFYLYRSESLSQGGKEMKPNHFRKLKNPKILNLDPDGPIDATFYGGNCIRGKGLMLMRLIPEHMLQ